MGWNRYALMDGVADVLLKDDICWNFCYDQHG